MNVAKIFENISFREHFWATASIVITWNIRLLDFSFFLLTVPMFIYWSFSSPSLCFCPTCQVIMIIQIYFDSYTFCTYVCHWINHHLVFFSESMSWHKKEKQQENSSEFFTLDLGKALINSILIKSSLGHSLLIPCSSSDACMLLFNANFSTCKLIIDWKFDKKQ